MSFAASLQAWASEPGISWAEARQRARAAVEISEAQSSARSLYLSSFNLITSLPQGLSVQGNLDLDGCTGITALPQGLSVQGNLYLIGCTGITALPQGLSVQGNLDLDGCTGITALPQGLSVQGNLYLIGCTGIPALPQGLSVQGDLYLRDCTGITALPQGLSVQGNLYLNGCTGITALPQGLSVQGSLYLSDCTGITALPQGLSVQGDLDLRGCTGITALPQGLSVQGDLDLRGCTGITALPQGLSVQGCLDLGGCTGITALPQGLSVQGYLDLSGCTGITALPQGLSVHSGLYLRGCTGITALPQGLSVQGDLGLSGCTGITALPQGLSVQGDLGLIGCTGITALPHELSVRGDLDLRGCTGITALPENIVSWGPKPDGGVRHIYLEGCGLSAAVLAQLRIAAQSADGMQFHFSEAPSWHGDEARFATLAEAAAFFAEQGIGDIQALLEAQSSGADEADAWRLWLGRLPEAADYTNAAVRPALLARLQAVVAEVVASPELRVDAARILGEAVATCGDRVVQGLDTLELLASVQRARRAPEPAVALEQLGLSLMRLEVVDRHAAVICERLRFVDQVEVYLKFHTRLRERLGLPGASATMLYGADVDAEQLEAAAKEAEAASADPVARAAFFAAWTPWQQQLRAEAAAALPFAAVPRRQLARAGSPLAELVCPITQMAVAELDEAVFLLDVSGTARRAFEHAALMAWWIEHGTDPASRAPLALAALVRSA